MTRNLAAGVNALAAHRRWWVAVAVLAALAGVAQALPSPYSHGLSFVGMVAVLCLFDARARFHRDETRRRVEASAP